MGTKKHPYLEVKAARAKELGQAMYYGSRLDGADRYMKDDRGVVWYVPQGFKSAEGLKRWRVRECLPV